MAIATELKKTLTDSTPLYAVAGAGDLVVEKIRELRVDIPTDPKVLRDRIQVSVESARQSVQTLPDRTQSLADKTQSFAKSQVVKAKEVYEDLAARGHKLVDRVDRQESTKRAKSSVRTTESKVKATTTAAKRGAVNARSQAKATATAAAKAADAAADAVEQGARKLGDANSKPTTTRTSGSATSSGPAAR
jgi:hypothetical protein